MAAVTVTQEGPYTLVSLKHGTLVDMRTEKSIFRQRYELFLQAGRRQQLAIYHGRIKGLDFGAARYACGEDFAHITRAKVLVLETMLNRTFANLMLKLNRPQFPVHVCVSVNQARELLDRHYLQRDSMEGRS